MSVTYSAEFLVNSTTVDLQFGPAMAGLTNGGFVAVWTDDSGSPADPSTFAVRGRVFDASGTPLGNDFPINNFTANEQMEPTVAALANGHFVVAWSDASGAAGDPDGYAIHAQVFDMFGDKVGVEFLIATTTAGNQFEPAITALSDGRFVVVWSDGSETGGDTDGTAVRARIYNADGTPSGGEFLVNATTDGWQEQPAITALADGRFVVAWMDTSQSGGDSDSEAIRARVFNADGTPAGGEFLVNTTWQSSQTQPTITTLADGRFVVAWSDDSASGGDPAGSSIRAQVFDADGSKSGNEVVVNTTVAGNQWEPAITALPDGRFAAVWTDTSPGNNATNINLVVFNADGTTWHGETTVNGTFGSPHNQPTIAALANGTFAVAWHDESHVLGDTSLSAVHARLFDPRSEGVTLAGTPVSDEYVGSRFADVLHGAGGNDLLKGAGGNDTLEGGAGDDQLDGGEGIDVAVYSGPMSAYAIEEVDDHHFQIVGPDGFDVVVNVEIAQFSDGTVPLTEPPEITSNGGGDAAAIRLLENVTAVTTVAATDPDEDPLAYSIVGGADAAQFEIDAATGALSFVTAPDFAAPADADHNNSYVVRVRASDGVVFDEQTITVNVAPDAAAEIRDGGNILVNTTTAGFQQPPAVAGLADGRFVVTWGDYSQSPDDPDGGAIRAQIFNGDGTKAGEEFLVNTTTASGRAGRDGTGRPRYGDHAGRRHHPDPAERDGRKPRAERHPVLVSSA